MGVYKGGYIDKDATQEEIIEALGRMQHNLSEILNRLSSDNIRNIEFGRTKTSGQIILKDEEGRERFIVGNRGGEFKFELRNKEGYKVLGIDENGNLI
jgi:hypothetical protein